MRSLNFAPLLAVLGGIHLLTDVPSRRQTLSAWCPAALKPLLLEESRLPVAVALPASVDECLFLTEWAISEGVLVLPVGGASSLMPPVSERAAIAVDVRRIDHLQWDEESLLVTAGAGKRLGEIETALNRHQYTLGQFPQTLEQMTVGGAIGNNAIGLLSGKYGRMRDITVGMEAVIPSLGIIRTAPGARAYRDIHDALIGAGGELGLLTEATLIMRPLPEARAFAIFSFGDFSQAIDAVRLIYRSDARPAGVRLLDTTAAARYCPASALLIAAFEGDELVQTGNYQLAHAICQQVGGTAQSPEIGDSWYDGRLETTWIAANARPDTLVDAFTVFGIWSKIKQIESGIRKAISPLTTKLSLQLCHPDVMGAALEIRFEQRVPADEPQIALERYQRVRMAGIQAAQENGGQYGHHYGPCPLDPEMIGDPQMALWKRLLQQD